MKIVLLGGPSFSVRISGCRCHSEKFRVTAPLSLGLQAFLWHSSLVGFPPEFQINRNILIDTKNDLRKAKKKEVQGHGS